MPWNILLIREIALIFFFQTPKGREMFAKTMEIEVSGIPYLVYSCQNCVVK